MYEKATGKEIHQIINNNKCWLIASWVTIVYILKCIILSIIFKVWE